VSELMLQQTQVSRVAERFGAFLDRFPTPAACASAGAGEVVKAWAGLGYNRRAMALHRLATAIVTEHGGRVPDRLESLLALPGVGPYTARAVLAFAFEAPVGVVEVNTGRVLARAFAGAPLGRATAQELADSAVPEGEGWAWSSAMVDLGALVCRRRAPSCEACPIEAACAWAAAGRAPPDPATGTAGERRRQSRFEGSDRQGRGRLVDALRHGPVALDTLAVACGWPDDADRARRVGEGLVADGLAASANGVLVLPEP